MDRDEKNLLIDMFNAAIAAADPAQILTGHMPAVPKGRTIVIGAGKGAAQLAATFEGLWDAPLEGVVVTRYGYAAACKNIRVLEAAHPLPDKSGLAGARAMIEAVTGLAKDDLVVALITGGGSALLPAPPAGFTLADEQALNNALLASGAPISAMNAIRKHFSGVKGGRLAAAAYPARVVSLIVSDVPGDAPSQVASGPTIADDTGRDAALAAIKTYNINLAPKVLEHIGADQAPLPSDAEFEDNTAQVIASANLSLEAAALVAKKAGLTPVILSDRVEGEAREVAKMHGAMAWEIRQRARPFTPPVVLLSGGETTVTLKGKGKGGRNTEFLLSLALTCDGLEGFSALAADTDGIDGSQDNAGAFIDGTSCARLRMQGIDPAIMLADNNAWSAFHALGDLFVPGPTGTNVNDFRAIIVR